MGSISRKAGQGLAALLIAAASAGGAAVAASPYDGHWDIDVTSESGLCEQRFHLPLAVSDGVVIYTGSFQAQAHGDVQPDGRVTLRFVYEGDVVDARGILRSASFGYGSWSSPTQRCGGTWVSRKRSG